MGVHYEYFSAASDEEAATVVGRLGGPSSQTTVLRWDESRRRILGRRRQPPTPVVGTDPDLVVYDTVFANGVDPVVMLGTLETLITTRAYDDVVEDPRSGHAVAERDGDECLVLTVTDSLAAALADASENALAQAAVPWSETEAFWDSPIPTMSWSS